MRILDRAARLPPARTRCSTACTTGLGPHAGLCAALELTTGDLNLRGSAASTRRARPTSTYLQGQPNDPDAKLRLIYARLGVGDLVTAGKLASELKPMDASTPAYYFAHAALAHAGVGSEGRGAGTSSRRAPSTASR